MAVNDILRASIEQSLHGQTLINVLHYRHLTEGAGTDDSAALAERIATVIIPVMKPCQSNELAHVRVIVQKFWPAPTLLPAFNVTAAGAGTVAQNSLPTSVAVTLTKRTAKAGVKYRGRLFIGGVPVTHEDNSNLAAASLAPWTALVAQLDADLTHAGGDVFRPIVWHHASKTYDDVIDVEVRTVLRNQRRRQVGKGK